jgi:hypothetical protein
MDVQLLLQLVNDNPDYFLDELLHLLRTERFVSAHYTTIHRELKRGGVPANNFERSQLSTTNLSVLTLLVMYQTMMLFSLPFWTKLQKTRGHQAGNLDELRRGRGHRKRSRSNVEGEYPLKR